VPRAEGEVERRPWVTWSWLRRYRMLAIAYGIALVLGVREFLLAREGEVSGTGACEASAASCFSLPAAAVPASDSAFWSSHARMTQVVAAVNPDDPNTDFLYGMQALAEGDEPEFMRRFEQALAAGTKHNHLLLQYYAQSLLDRSADWQLVNQAVNRWRVNHPSSPEKLVLQLGAGPRTPSDSLALREALARVPWIAGADLESYQEMGSDRWRLQLAFRPGQPVDVREAIAAVSVLSVPEEQRPYYIVTCQTLQDCTATRRLGG
jgi:hypothetical protein